MQFTDTLSSSIDKSAALVPLAKRVAAALRQSWRGAQAGILTADMLNALGNGVRELILNNHQFQAQQKFMLVMLAKN